MQRRRNDSASEGRSVTDLEYATRIAAAEERAERWLQRVISEAYRAKRYINPLDDPQRYDMERAKLDARIREATEKARRLLSVAVERIEAQAYGRHAKQEA